MKVMLKDLQKSKESLLDKIKAEKKKIQDTKIVK
jgi:hypothetical protein